MPQLAAHHTLLPRRAARALDARDLRHHKWQWLHVRSIPCLAWGSGAEYFCVYAMLTHRASQTYRASDCASDLLRTVRGAMVSAILSTRPCLPRVPSAAVSPRSRERRRRQCLHSDAADGRAPYQEDGQAAARRRCARTCGAPQEPRPGAVGAAVRALASGPPPSPRHS